MVFTDVLGLSVNNQAQGSGLRRPRATAMIGYPLYHLPSPEVSMISVARRDIHSDFYDWGLL